jgi:hypothetical protein
MKGTVKSKGDKNEMGLAFLPEPLILKGQVWSL